MGDKGKEIIVTEIHQGSGKLPTTTTAPGLSPRRCYACSGQSWTQRRLPLHPEAEGIPERGAERIGGVMG